MRICINIIFAAILSLFVACKNDIVYHELPIVYNGIITDNYPCLWSIRPSKKFDDVLFNQNYPQYNNGKYIISAINGHILSLDAETGKVQWEFPLREYEIIVKNYFIPQNEEFIILCLNEGPGYSTLTKLNLSDGSEQWRIVLPLRGSTDYNWKYSHIGDSHLYLSALIFDGGVTSSNQSAVFKLDLQTGDTTRVLRAAPQGDYTQTQCRIHSITHQEREVWIVSEGLLNPTNGSDIWQTYLRDAVTGDTLAKPFKSIPHLPASISQNHVPDNILWYKNKIFIYNNVAFSVFDLESMSLVHQQVLENCEVQGYMEQIYEPIVINNKFILNTYHRQWMINMDNYEILISNIDINKKPVNKQLPKTPNLVDGIYYIADGRGFRAYDFETYSCLLRITTNGLASCATYKNDKGEVFVVFSNNEGIHCYPGLTSSHHKIDMLDYIKNKTNIR